LAAVIVNAYSVLAAFVGLVELVLGVSVVALGVAALRRSRRPLGDAPADSGVFLPFLVATVLLGVSLASWPLLYLLLDSYVPQWPDVMCIEGVTRIGTGSAGAAGRLPTLLHLLQATKPALVFATGAWLVLHVANRRTRTAPLTRRVLAALLVAGAVAVLDAGAQLAYVAIPKQETFLSQGCCTLADPGGRGSGLLPLDSDRSRTGLFVAFYGVTAAMALGTWLAASRPAPARTAPRPVPLLLGALLSVPVGVLFLRHVAAPAFLGLPYHPCPYCLLSAAPVGVVGVSLYLLGVFGAGWGAVGRWLGDVEETRATLPPQARALHLAGLFGYLGALLLTSTQLAIA
jgi:hypothetical protein